MVSQKEDETEDEHESEFQLMSGRLKSPAIISWLYFDSERKKLNTSTLRETSQEGDRYTQHMRIGEGKASSTVHTSGGAELLVWLEGIVLVV